MHSSLIVINVIISNQKKENQVLNKLLVNTWFDSFVAMLQNFSDAESNILIEITYCWCLNTTMKYVWNIVWNDKKSKIS